MMKTDSSKLTKHSQRLANKLKSSYLDYTGLRSDFYGIFVYYILISLCAALYVGDIPAEGFKERVDKFAAKLCFVVLLVFVGFDIAVECFGVPGILSLSD